MEIGKELSHNLIKYVAEVIGKNIHLLPKVQKELYQIQIQNQMNDPFSAVPTLKYRESKIIYIKIKQAIDL